MYRTYRCHTWPHMVSITLGHKDSVSCRLRPLHPENIESNAEIMHEAHLQPAVAHLVRTSG